MFPIRWSQPPCRNIEVKNGAASSVQLASPEPSPYDTRPGVRANVLKNSRSPLVESVTS